MKELKQTQAFLWKYSMGSGVLLALLGWLLRTPWLMGIGLVFALVGGAVLIGYLRSMRKRKQIRQAGVPLEPIAVTVRQPRNSWIHHRGLYIFYLECRYEDGQQQKKLTSPTYTILRCSQYLTYKGGSCYLTKTPLVYIYQDPEGNTAIDAFLQK